MSKDKSPYVAIPASLGGILLVLVCAVLIFTSETLVNMTNLIWGFVTLGIAALFFQFLADKQKK